MNSKTVSFARSCYRNFGYRVKPYQKEAWLAYESGCSGIISLPTGAGKTYAALFGPLFRIVENAVGQGVQLIYITPLKALARDLGKAINQIVSRSDLPINVDIRTGDTSSYRKAKQNKKLGDILITTPESLAILISYPNSKELFQNCHSVVVDEWHAFYSNKRGLLLLLQINFLEAEIRPMQIWGLSATLGSAQEARLSLLNQRPCKMIEAHQLKRKIAFKVLIPKKPQMIPLAGHSGLAMIKTFVDDFDWEQPSLVFTNTRSFAEIWYQALVEEYPDRTDQMGLHHGSLDQVNRAEVESELKSGKLRLVVCTSTLDLGIDFSPIKRVYQVGSPKFISRLLQRAGRSGHRPGGKCSIRFVPTHAFEVFELEALKSAISKNQVEEPQAQSLALDVVIQHMVSLGCGPGFDRKNLLSSLRRTWAYRDLSDSDYNWCLEFASSGGKALRSYEKYNRLILKSQQYVISDKKLAQIHRMNIGTITADATLQIKFRRGKRLGTIEERFISQLKKGDHFIHGGRILSYDGSFENTIYVKPGTKKKAPVPKWIGSNMALSAPLADNLRNIIESSDIDKFTLNCRPIIRTIIDNQRKHSLLPKPGEFLIETAITKEGYHCFLYPFEGYHINQAIGMLLSLILGSGSYLSFQISVNEYGIELFTKTKFDFATKLNHTCFDAKDIAPRLEKSVNFSEMGQQQFKTIARIAGLVITRLPGKQKSARQIRTSSELIFKVFQRFDPENLLLRQVKQELMKDGIDKRRLRLALQRIQKSDFVMKELDRLTPFSMPLWASRAALSIDSEPLRDRIKMIQDTW